EVPRGSIAFELEEQQRTRNRCVDSRAVLLDQRVQTWICTAPVVALIAHAAYGGEIQSGISSRECNETDAINAARRSALMPPGRPDQLARLIDQLLRRDHGARMISSMPGQKIPGPRKLMRLSCTSRQVSYRRSQPGVNVNVSPFCTSFGNGSHISRFPSTSPTLSNFTCPVNP